MKQVTLLLGYLLLLAGSGNAAYASGDQDCWQELLGYDQQTNTLWQEMDCSGCRMELRREKVGVKKSKSREVSAKKAPELDEYGLECLTEPESPADQLSLARAKPLIALPPTGFTLRLRGKKEIAEGETRTFTMRSAHGKSASFQLKLVGATMPRVYRAWLIPGTARAVAEVRYGGDGETKTNCCPLDFLQHFQIIDYAPNSKGTQGGAVDLRVGPDYLAIISGETRRQVSLPCSTESRKGRAAPSLPFTLRCGERPEDNLTVQRTGRQISVMRGTVEKARLYLPGLDTSVAIRAEKVVHSYEHPYSERDYSLVCASDGRCTLLVDSDTIRKVKMQMKERCIDGYCLLVSKRRGELVVGSDEEYFEAFFAFPKMSPGDRLLGLRKGGDYDIDRWLIRKADGTKWTPPVKR